MDWDLAPARGATTFLPFGDWISIFGNETLTTALLDRLTGKGHILEFIGESYRFRQRFKQEEQQDKTEQAETGS
jgi:DNA replication protein DnaC